MSSPSERTNNQKLKSERKNKLKREKMASIALRVTFSKFQTTPILLRVFQVILDTSF